MIRNRVNRRDGTSPANERVFGPGVSVCPEAGASVKRMTARAAGTTVEVSTAVHPERIIALVPGTIEERIIGVFPTKEVVRDPGIDVKRREGVYAVTDKERAGTVTVTLELPDTVTLGTLPAMDDTAI